MKYSVKYEEELKKKKYNKEEQKAMAAWAADCAERVLPLFEMAYPEDDRPRIAIETCRSFVITGVFKMAIIRKASLDAHAAARAVQANNAARFAARAAGQAVATAHVSQHAIASAWYALKAVAAGNPENTEKIVEEERNRQANHLPIEFKEKLLIE